MKERQKERTRLTQTDTGGQPEQTKKEKETQGRKQAAHTTTYLCLCARYHSVGIIAPGIPPFKNILVHTAIKHSWGVPLKEDAIG